MSAALSPSSTPLRVVVSAETDESVLTIARHLDVEPSGYIERDHPVQAVRDVTNAAGTVVGAMRVQTP